MSTITSSLFSRFSNLADFSSPIAHVSQMAQLHKKIENVMLISLGLIALAYILDPCRKILDAQGNGQGRISYFFGAVIYEGTFKNRQLIQGIQRYSFWFANVTYEGTFKENELNGPGGKRVDNYGHGEVTSVGFFKNNRLNDPQGKRTHSRSGLVEEGSFEDDLLVQGKQTFSDGAVLDGIFNHKSKLVDKGTFTLPHGVVIKGAFKIGDHGTVDGPVTYTHPNGMIIEGNGIFKNGRFDGKAQITSTTGEVAEVIFKHNKIIKGDK